MQTIKIDLVSDIACPWCAIGYARLQQALSTLPQIPVELEWHAFELNPDKNAPQEPILPALSRKYGRSEQEMAENQAQMMKIAADLGLNFTKLQQRYTCNTFDGHRLVKWAASQQKADEMKLALFNAYFGEAKNVADHQVLAECAEQAGLDKTKAARILASNDYIDEVNDDIAKYKQAGISSVPAFIINNQYLISGAQEPKQLATALLQIASEMT
ncbi:MULTISPECIES: DsbA family oxidoreductase [Rheinheimera]|uniref:DsbA family oxidoreductase n=1 Tax=Rheinheimera TaxID=67575 RepID=UPI00104E7F50|nr:DsbA family oxidoreductase [Rheinheimera sp. D18]QBL09179.1 DsbA family oxidoreductase [Rheinheimera sp. D18]